ncbi:MAG: hypothetical protein LBF22_06420 [Deltaproteobacteria bacterium]|jgi:hypothetical protein|nr:hypothetical protein [Deltaproteobacteria bacterium]
MFLRYFFCFLLLAITILGNGIANAESPVTFSGYLRVRSWILDNYWATSAAGSTSRGDSYAETRFRLNLVFKPNDKVEIRWRGQAPHNSRWGTTTTADLYLRSIYFFGIAKFSFGNISVGRISSDVDTAGLATLGYAPTWGVASQGFIFDSDNETDGLMYRFNGETFGVKAYYVKRSTTAPTALESEHDYNKISVEPYYKWKSGGISLALQYDMNKNTTNNISYKFFSINPSLVNTWDLGDGLKLSTHLEAKFSFGERAFPYTAAFLNDRGLDETKVSGAGVYFDFNIEYGAGSTTFAGWWLDGTPDDASQNPRRVKRRDLVTAGTAFYPFLLFYHGYGSSQLSGSIPLEGREIGTFNDFNTNNSVNNYGSNHWALALLGKYKVMDGVTITYGLGSFNRTKAYTLADGTSASKSLGTEANVGVIVKLLDNLTWTSTAAAFIPGDYYQDRYHTATNKIEADRTIFGWGNEFVFSF